MKKADKKILKLTEEELEELIKAVQNSNLPEEEMVKISATLETFGGVLDSLKMKQTSLARLRSILGIKTEKNPKLKSIPIEIPKELSDDEKKSLQEEVKKEEQRILIREWMDVLKK